MLWYILFWTVVGGIFGALVGSFLNALIYRLPRASLSVFRPKRSFCPDCGSAIVWYDNLPVVSFVLLNGSCRSCGARISIQYPFVEVLTAVLYACLTYTLVWDLLEGGGGSLQLYGAYVLHLYFIAALVAVTFIDMEFQIIPDEINYSGMIIALLACAAFPALQEQSRLYQYLASGMNSHIASLLSSLSGALAGGGALLLVGYLGKVILKREALGMGDVKLMFFVGAMFGWEGVLWVFILGCALGSLVGVPYRIVTGKREIPFGPFLSSGALLVLFFQGAIRDFIFVTWPRLIGSLVG